VSRAAVCLRTILIVVCAAAAQMACTPAQSSTPGEGRWRDLFDGQSLDGWQKLNGSAPYRVVDGAIRGINVLQSPNSFLATEAEYSDFVLEFEARSQGMANSGVQFRTEAAPGTWSGVIGYQLDIDPTERRWTGGIYHEGVHRWRHSMARKPDCRAAYRHGEWNSYRIEAVGAVIASWVNGVACAHMAGDHHERGVVALQIHDIGVDESLVGSYTEWRDLRLLPDPEPADLWQARRFAHVEGWLTDRLVEAELTEGWEFIDFGTERPVLNLNASTFELVMDVRVDGEVTGQLDYVYVRGTQQCAGAYRIANDEVFGDVQSATLLMGSVTDRLAAMNLSEPGRPKRVYSGDRLNRVRLVLNERQVQHWLNGVLVAEYPACDDVIADVSELVRSDRTPPVRIALQINGDDVEIGRVRLSAQSE
jgi:hypothetical protein